jgi:hypothetical protein
MNQFGISTSRSHSVSIGWKVGCNAPHSVPPDVSHILKGFLALSIKLTAFAVVAGYGRLRLADQRLSSQQSLDSDRTVA